MTQTAHPTKSLPMIAKLAVRHGFITKAQLKRALSIQALETEKGLTTSLPEILAKTGMISSARMVELHKIASGQSEKPTAPEPETSYSDDTKPFEILVSEDAMSANLFQPNNNLQADAKDVIDMAREMGITHGIVRESSIQSKLMGAKNGNAIIIARGTPPDPGRAPSIDYRFDVSHHRIADPGPESLFERELTNPGEVREGDLLAEKTPMVPPDSGVDIFGNTIPVQDIEDLALRPGNGCEVFEDQLKVYATANGVPFLNTRGCIEVFPLAVFKSDYGVVSGPVERLSCITTEKILTGEFPVRGGNVAAEEIRNARIDVTGRVDARIGITGSVIKAQGDIRARYIRGSVIETFGSVFVENEIMDSTIHCSGVLICERSKIVTSKIIAGAGLKAQGIGTATSTPCEITVGTTGHLDRVIDGINRDMDHAGQRIQALEETAQSLSGEEKNIRQKIGPLATFHKKAEKAILTTQALLDELNQKKLRKRIIAEEKNLNELKAKDKDALSAIRSYSDRLKEITKKIATVAEEIETFQEEIAVLALDRSAISSWAETRTFYACIEVAGTLHSGTVISGLRVSMMLDRNFDRVLITEEVTGPEGMEEGKLVFGKPRTVKKAEPPSGGQP